ncbi:MAG: 4-hydroxy-tetrahydrodipicolinate reductase [Bacillota bacterium]|jgi:4-hydroxy-tetrahydrodipicolinate reductase
MAQIKVLVAGACGRMGREVVKTVCNDPELELVGVVDNFNAGKDIGGIVGLEPVGISVCANLGETLETSRAEVMVDFTTPQSVLENIRTALKKGVHTVVGTTGLAPDDVEELRQLSEAHRANLLVVPNFAVGALLMMRFAALAAQYMPQVEIIELHHDQKLDAPSGTAVKTAEMIIAARGTKANSQIGKEKIQGVRGGEMEGIHLHSVRLPGFIAHQEVIFGAEGQTLTIRHDSISRESFMPGVTLAIKNIKDRPGLTYGLDQLLF